MTVLIRDFRELSREEKIKLSEEDLQALIFDIFSMNSEILKKNEEFVKATENGE